MREASSNRLPARPGKTLGKFFFEGSRASFCALLRAAHRYCLKLNNKKLRDLQSLGTDFHIIHI
jgi:hypothetical protein